MCVILGCSKRRQYEGPQFTVGWSLGHPQLVRLPSFHGEGAVRVKMGQSQSNTDVSLEASAVQKVVKLEKDYRWSKDPCRAFATLNDSGKHNFETVESKTGNDPCPKDHLRVVTISDTHGKHRKITKYNPLPEGDVLIHAGDFTNTGELSQISDFCEWMGTLPYKHKVVIAGNHDLTLDGEWYSKPENHERFHKKKKKDEQKAMAMMRECKNFHYLEEQTVIVEGYKVFGTPYQPEFFNWAFNLGRGHPCDEAWEKIPTDTDILVTHGPPLGHGDLCQGSDFRAGCLDLLRHVQKRVKPLVHVFGHIHEGYGTTSNNVTTFINASTCNFTYRPMNKPIVFDLPRLNDTAGCDKKLQAGLESSFFFGTMGRAKNCTNMYKATLNAISSGCRHFDLGENYDSSEQVGRALSEATERKNIFVTSKFDGMPVGHYDTHVKPRVLAMLEKAKLSYFDLLLIHYPVAKDNPGLFKDPTLLSSVESWQYFVEHAKEAWENMAKLRQDGFCKHIGLSNCYGKHVAEFMKYAEEGSPIYANQIFIDIAHPETEFVEQLQSLGIRVFAYRPLEYLPSLAKLGLLAGLSEAAKATPGCLSTQQFVLAWLRSRNISPIVFSSSTDHIKKNMTPPLKFDNSSGTPARSILAAIEGAAEMINMVGGVYAPARAFKAMCASAEIKSYRFGMDNNDWKSHLRDHGFVVLANVMDAYDVNEARKLLWKDIARLWPGTCPENWKPMDIPPHGLLPQLAQSAGAWHVRGNANVKHAFEEIWDGEKELITSMDAVICWRPWGDATSIEPPRTEGFHLDQNPFDKPDLEVIQGMVPLHDVTSAVGGLCVVPRSHLIDARKALQERCPYFAGAGDWCPLPASDPCIENQILVEARAGDLILWDARTVHGGKVGYGKPDHVYGCSWRARLSRMSVPVSMTQIRRASEETLRSRREGFEKGRCFNHTPHEIGSAGSMSAPEDARYQPCKLSVEQHRLIDGKVRHSSFAGCKEKGNSQHDTSKKVTSCKS
jgi:diketogulonate reductase-like aldo/keto reductase/Icc-related predicted phosphoesterase